MLSLLCCRSPHKEERRGRACSLVTEMQGDSWPIRGWLTPTFTSPLIYSLSNAQGMCSSAVKKWLSTHTHHSYTRIHAKTQKNMHVDLVVLELTTVLQEMVKWLQLQYMWYICLCANVLHMCVFIDTAEKGKQTEVAVSLSNRQLGDEARGPLKPVECPSSIAWRKRQNNSSRAKKRPKELETIIRKRKKRASRETEKDTQTEARVLSAEDSRKR